MIGFHSRQPNLQLAGTLRRDRSSAVLAHRSAPATVQGKKQEGLIQTLWVPAPT